MPQDRVLILNITRGFYLSSEAEIADTLYRRMRGLIGRSKKDFSDGRGLWIIPSNGIHTVGMSFPIDVVYLDSAKRVLKLYHRLAPFRIAAVKLKARSILELPEGMLEKSRTEVGDLLEFRPVSDPSDIKSKYQFSDPSDGLPI